MENYVGVMFPTLAEASAGKAALLELSRRGSVRLERAGIFVRGKDGKLVREDSDTGPRGGTDEEAAAALERVLTHGMYAVLARVNEEDPRPINDAMDANGGLVYRRSIEQIESLDPHRVTGPSSLE